MELGAEWKLVKVDRPNILFGPASKAGRTFFVLDVPSVADISTDAACRTVAAPMVDLMKGIEPAFRVIDTSAGTSCEFEMKRGPRVYLSTLIPTPDKRLVSAMCEGEDTARADFLAECRQIVASWKVDAATVPIAAAPEVPERRVRKNGVSVNLLDGWEMVDEPGALLSVSKGTTNDTIRTLAVQRANKPFDVGTAERCVAAGDRVKGMNSTQRSGNLFNMIFATACVVLTKKDARKTVFVMFAETPYSVTCTGNNMTSTEVGDCGTIAGSLEIEK